MKLYQRFGIVFSIFSLVTLVWNVFTPNNPDHFGNIILCGLLGIFLSCSLTIQERYAKTLQVTTFLLAAFVPVHFTGEMFFGAVCIVVSLALMYAYGGYRTQPIWKLPLTFALVLTLFSISSPVIGPESTMRALMWTVYIAIACLALWLIVDDMEKRFHEKISSGIEHNRQEIESLKKSIGGLSNAP